MFDALFAFIAVFTVVCALGAMLSRNTVDAAMCLLLCLAGVAGLFVALHAFLLAFVLLLVYAGAVVTLFLFIIMLIDVRGAASPPRRHIATAAGAAALVLVVAGLASLATRGRLSLPPPPPGLPVGESLKAYAELLFTTYLLPVQLIGFLLLIAMLGVIALSRKAP
jgi:NADH-quinone oxidoreductase subunit J